MFWLIEDWGVFMKICFIGQYPPIEGGESSKLYQLARALGKRGHEVHIVTNAFCVEKIFRENLRGEDIKFYQPRGVFVHNVDPFKLPTFIPQSSAFCERLTSLACYIVRKHNIDLIEGWYLVPYGTAAFLTSVFTGKPLVLRHAGSDLNRIGRSPYFAVLINNILKSAQKVITYPSRFENIKERGVIPRRIFINRSTAVDVNLFSPSNKISCRRYLPSMLFKERVPIITYIGKISENKGLIELLEALSLIKSKISFKFLVLGNGRRRFKEAFKRAIKNYRLEEEVVLGDFIPHWRIPAVIKMSALVVHPEFRFPIKVHNPILVREVMAAGGCLLISDELYKKQPREFVKDGKNVVVIDPSKPHLLAEKILNLLGNPRKIEEIKKRARVAAVKREDFDHYVDEFERLYLSLLPVQGSLEKGGRKLILLRGLPGVGKTTVSRLVKKKKPSLAVIKLDTMRRIVSDNPNPHFHKDITIQMIAKAADFLLQKNFSVLVENVFAHEKEMEPFYLLAKKYQLSFYVLELTAPRVILKKRISSGKPLDPLKGGVVRFDRLYSDFKKEKLDPEKYPVIKIKTDNVSPEKVARQIISLVWSR